MEIVRPKKVSNHIPPPFFFRRNSDSSLTFIFCRSCVVVLFFDEVHELCEPWAEGSVVAILNPSTLFFNAQEFLREKLCEDFLILFRSFYYSAKSSTKKILPQNLIHRANCLNRDKRPFWILFRNQIGK